MIVNAIFFVFISLSLVLVLAFIEPSSLRTHFRPFTDVLRKILRSLTRKVSQFLNKPRITRMARMGSDSKTEGKR
jgi:hypothetical protein